MGEPFPGRQDEPGTKRTMENLGALHTVYGDDVILRGTRGPSSPDWGWGSMGNG